MNHNPVFEKERKRNTRSMRISWLIFFCNLLLAFVAFTCYFGESSLAGYLSPASYSVPMNCYLLMCYLLFFLVIFSIPALAGGSISQEREKKTLDILLTTNLNPWKIIFGKLETSLGILFIVAVSTLPVLSLITVFGGIHLWDLIIMILALLGTGIYVGSIGILCSVYLKRTILATVVSYMIVLFLIAGTAGGVALADYVVLLEEQSGSFPGTIDMAKASYVLLLNPFFTFAGWVTRQLGSGHEMEEICRMLGNTDQNLIIRHMTEFGTAIQFLLSGGMLVLAEKKLNPFHH